MSIQTRAEIAKVCDALKAMLIEKNEAYGDSALDPVRVFSKADTIEQLKVRIDDKLSRMMRGQAAGEDVEWDLMGYLVLLRIARQRDSKAEPGMFLEPMDPAEPMPARVVKDNNMEEVRVVHTPCKTTHHPENFRP